MIGTVIRRKRGEGVGTGLEATAHYEDRAPALAAETTSSTSAPKRFDARALTNEIRGEFSKLGRVDWEAGTR